MRNIILSFARLEGEPVVSRAGKEPDYNYDYDNDNEQDFNYENEMD